MWAKTRSLALTLLALAICFALTACMGQWFTPNQQATLVIGNIVKTGNQGEVLVSVVNMPDGGAAAILLGTLNNEAITFHDIDPSTITATGLNGFAVLAQDFTTNNGMGCLLGINPSTGITGGEILRITFKIDGANATLTVPQANKVRIKLASDLNTWIALQKVEAGKAFYAK